MVSLPTIALRNLAQHRLRSVLTVVAVALTVLQFLVLRAGLDAWQQGGADARNDRLAIRSRISWSVLLPTTHAAEIAALEDVAAATWVRWYGGRDARHPRNFLVSMAVDPPSALEVFDELEISPAERASWLADPGGALIGDALAKRHRWQVGDRVVLTGGIYAGEIALTVRAIYRSGARVINRSQLLFHAARLDQLAPEGRRNRAAWLLVRTVRAADPAAVAARIDAHFRRSGAPTLTQNERELNRYFLDGFAVVVYAMRWAALALLVVLALIIGNTVAMSVRERSREHAVLRALGFRPAHVVWLVVLEAVAMGALGGFAGALSSYPVVEFVGRAIDELAGGFLPPFRPSHVMAMSSFGLSALLAGVVAAIPALAASGRRVSDALGRHD